MTRPLIIRPEAESDLREACAWYEGQASGLSGKFLQEIDRTLTRLHESPRVYAKVEKEARRALIRRFPYGIIFIEEPDKVVVLAVMNQARDPGRWQERIS